MLDWHTKACLFYLFFQQNQPALSSLPFLLPFWKKSALTGQAESCAVSLVAHYRFLSNTQNGFVVSDRGSEDLPSVTASASLTFDVQNTAGKALENYSTSLRRWLSGWCLGSRVESSSSFSHLAVAIMCDHKPPQPRLASWLLICST